MYGFIAYMFLLGLGTSLHCVSMCGPLVLTYAVKGDAEGPWYHKITPNIAYQGAKILSYMVIGTALGFLGALINLNAVRPWVMFAAGAFMIVLGLGMTGKVPWALRFTPKPPKFLMAWLSKLRRKSTADAAAGESSLTTPIAFGLMTGLLPCGPLMAAEVSAAASGSAITGAAGMAAFAIGTAPLMVAFGTAGSLIPRVWKERMMVVLAVAVMLFGLVFVNRGLTLVGSPVTFTAIEHAVIGNGAGSSAAYKTDANGVVTVPLAIVNTQYQPATLSIPAGKPVRIVVDRKEDAACSKYLVFPQLGIQQALADNGVTVVNLPATKAGTYTMTCGMGMMQGALVVGAAPARAGGGGISPIVLLLFVVAGAGVAAVAVKRSRRTAEGAARHRSGNGSQHGGGKSSKQSGGKAPVGSGDAVVLGFTRSELIAVAVVVAAAAVLGLVISGGLHF